MNVDTYFQKAKDEDQEMNGADDDETEKPKKKASPPKKAPVADKKVTEKKAPTKKRAAKKVLLKCKIRTLYLHIGQDAEDESGEDFAEDIDNVPADEDDDELSEAENKKRKVRLSCSDIIPMPSQCQW